jgi:hypothetical protein
MVTTPTTLELWRTLHDIAERVPDVPEHRRVQVALAVAHLERLVDGEEPEPPGVWAF